MTNNFPSTGRNAPPRCGFSKESLGERSHILLPKKRWIMIDWLRRRHSAPTFVLAFPHETNAQVVSSELPYPSVKTQFRWPYLRLRGPLNHFRADATREVKVYVDLGPEVGRNTHSRQTVNSAAMITGPRNKPMRPNAASPPKIPTNARRNGSRADPPTKIGQTK